jgi:hypothetical protein
VEKIVRITEKIGREVASAEEAGAILGLEPGRKDRILNML